MSFFPRYLDQILHYTPVHKIPFTLVMFSNNIRNTCTELKQCTGTFSTNKWAIPAHRLDLSKLFFYSKGYLGNILSDSRKKICDNEQPRPSPSWVLAIKPKNRVNNHLYWMTLNSACLFPIPALLPGCIQTITKQPLSPLATIKQCLVQVSYLHFLFLSFNLK